MKKSILTFLFSILVSLAIRAQSGPNDFKVTTAANAGPGSLRQAILDANAYTGSLAPNLYYRIPGNAATIYISSPLPVITVANLTSSNKNQGMYPLTVDGGGMAGPVFRYSFRYFENTLGIGVNFSSTSYSVTTTDADGAGSLKQIQGYSEQTTVKDYINFNIPGAAPQILNYTGLITFIYPIVIDGSTQPANGYSGVMPKVEFANSITLCGKSSEMYGFTFQKTSALTIDGSSKINPINNGYAHNSTIGKPGSPNVFFGGAYLYYANDVLFQNNYIGMDLQSAPASTLSNGLDLFFSKNANVLNNTIGNCDFGISANSDTNTVIRGNKVGTSIGGIAAVPNNYGIDLSSSVNAIVGGTGINDGNLISGNLITGLSCTGSIRVYVLGNYIGTDITGMAGLPNNLSHSYLNQDGVAIHGCDSVVIGGNSSSAGNTIASNARNEIYIASTTKLYFYGNKIGVGKDGTTPLSNNSYSGVGINVESTSTIEIGKVISGYGNVFSAFQRIGSVGVWVNNGNKLIQYQSKVSIRGNSFFNNAAGVASVDGTVPVITNVTAAKVEGYADPSSVVDLYYHNGTGAFQGKTYFATVNASASGKWVYNGSISNACSITAAATKNGRTTQFSQQYKLGNLGPDKVVCQNSAPIALTASGGSNYSWFPETGLSDAHVANPFFQPSTTQTYMVSLTNNLGCPGSDTITIFVDEALIKPRLGADTAICSDATLLLDGGNYLNSSYLWSTGQTSRTIQGLSANTYSLTVTNTCGSVKDTISISIANCGEISGMVYDDYNGNCTYELTDVPLKQKIIKLLPGPVYTMTDTTGSYSVKVPYNTYEIALLPIHGRTQVCNPGNYTATVSSSNKIVLQKDYALYNSNTIDGSIRLSSSVPVVGRAFTYTLEVQNNGVFNFSGQLLFHYDEFVTFVSTDLLVIDHTDRMLTLDCPVLTPGKKIVVHLNFTVLPDASLYGKRAVATAELTLPADYNPIDNTITLEPLIRSSYDPNIKEVFPSGATTAKLIPVKDSILYYTVRFQNEGIAPADSITIRDTLSEHLNIETLIALNASHAYNIDILGNNVIQWTFNHINLPSKMVDEERSQGYVQFSIHTKKNLIPNSKIQNGAYIYFDHNPFVATNTVFNTLAFPLSGTMAYEDRGCAEGTLALAAILEGGIPPYSYAWANRTESDSLLTNLISGTYTCTITDASEYEIELTETISEPAALSIFNTITNASCQGSDDGQISLNVSGGTPAYTFNWSGGQSIPTISQLRADTYTLTLTDGNDCSITASYVVNESTVPCVPTSDIESSSVGIVSVYPNPAKEYMVFDVLTEDRFNLVIKDISGHEVFREENITGAYTLFKAKLNSGVFIYNVYTEEKELGKGKIIVLD